MTTKPPKTDWVDVNRRLLAVELERLRALLTQPAVPSAEPQRAAADRRNGAEADAGSAPAGESALDMLCARFRLSAFERDVLLLCAAVELDTSFAALCAAANGGAQFAHPTFSLALTRLPEAHWSAIAPHSALRYWRLIEVADGASVVTARLHIDERVLHYLCGVNGLDERLFGVVHIDRATAPLSPSQHHQAERLCACWSASVRPVIHLVGDDPAAARAVVGSACRALGMPLVTLRAESIAAAADRAALIRLLNRETLLTGGAVLVDASATAGHAQPQTFLEEIDGPLAVLGGSSASPSRRSVVVEVCKPLAEEQRSLWAELIGAESGPAAPLLDGLVAHFHLGAEQIADALLEARAAARAGESPAGGLWRACRARARGSFGDLAQRIETRADWDDLVLAPQQIEVLRDMARQVRHRTTVHHRWGFAAKSAGGLGVTALFAGESGTGKTLAAEVLARDLDLDLYRIDLSAVVSKYIGETEKNLKRVFDAAEAGGAVLLFDEADALFGKRGEVRDSHDRYANIEVSYLLQRMETYLGLAILTTNMRSVLDAAFVRRLRFIVAFAFPDSAQREAIWRRVFPPATPLAELDFAALARLNVAGGAIRNIALHAAFAAADAGEAVSMAHLLRAARCECAKSDRQLSAHETRDWA